MAVLYILYCLATKSTRKRGLDVLINPVMLYGIILIFEMDESISNIRVAG